MKPRSSRTADPAKAQYNSVLELTRSDKIITTDIEKVVTTNTML